MGLTGVVQGKGCTCVCVFVSLCLFMCVCDDLLSFMLFS